MRHPRAAGALEDALEKGIQDGDPFAEALRQKAQGLFSALVIQMEKPQAPID